MFKISLYVHVLYVLYYGKEYKKEKRMEGSLKKGRYKLAVICIIQKIIQYIICLYTLSSDVSLSTMLYIILHKLI